MSPGAVGLIGIICFLVLILLRIPISYAMFIVGFLGCSYLNSFSTATRILTQETFTTLASYSLSVVPMFMLMGQFAFYAGIRFTICL